MIQLDRLEALPTVGGLLVPKRKILELARKTEGSMLKFQTIVKHSSEIDELATEFFTAKSVADDIQNKSKLISMNNLTEKIHKIKNIKVASDDFI